ncbi:hypothetical protein L6452_10187 [Arctium lappa]|uniref:Uncharacterized protein n=1 Tax=Arctium lappa TaxID=4217 RepID=A0ACB9DMJ7_ARCLA|nr:hypothetical protein L6452_10187 [Arctium lappa]
MEIGFANQLTPSIFEISKGLKAQIYFEAQKDPFLLGIIVSSKSVGYRLLHYNDFSPISDVVFPAIDISSRIRLIAPTVSFVCLITAVSNLRFHTLPFPFQSWSMRICHGQLLSSQKLEMAVSTTVVVILSDVWRGFPHLQYTDSLPYNVVIIELIPVELGCPSSFKRVNFLINTTEVQEMQDHGMVPVEETTVPKPTKRKPTTRKLPKNQTQENSVKGAHEVTRPSKSSKREAPQIFQQQEKSNSDSLPDSSTGNEYRSLRHKYLLLEEESFNLGRETKDIQDAVNSLEEEKLSLLDELVVLEGLVDPSELDAGRRLP